MQELLVWCLHGCGCESVGGARGWRGGRGVTPVLGPFFRYAGVFCQFVPNASAGEIKSNRRAV